MKKPSLLSSFVLWINVRWFMGIALGALLLFHYGIVGALAACPGPTSTISWGSNTVNLPSIPGNQSGPSAAIDCEVASASGMEHSVTLYCDGTVSAWSDENRYGQADVPAIADVVAIAAGGFHNLALLADGTVVAWGSEHNVPPQASNVVAIAAGYEHSVALRNDGIVIAWGEWGLWSSSPETNVPPDLSNVVAISSASIGSHTLALKADGTVVAWGENTYGQTNVPIGLTNVAAIQAGARYSQATVGDGSPWITLQPWCPRRIKPGSMVPIRAFAVGAPPLFYQWQRDGIDIPGATNTTLMVGPLQPSDAGHYRLCVSNALCTATSEVATLLLPRGDSLLAEALDATNLLWFTSSGNPWFAQTTVTSDGSDAAQALGADCDSSELLLETTVAGPGSLGFRWKIGSGSGYGQLTFAVDDAQVLALAGIVDWRSESIALAPGLHTLRWVFVAGCSEDAAKVETGWLDQVTFANADNELAPILAQPPGSQVVALGRDASFSVSVVCYPPPIFQWRFNGTNLPDATNELLVLPNVQHMQAGLYSVLVSNALGTAASEDVTLTIVEAPPVVSLQPSNQFTHLGGPACFQVTVEGSCPMQYQWRFNGADLPDATSSNLIIDAVQFAQRGQYSVFVRNQFGDTTSSNATLVVSPIAAWSESGPECQELVPGDLTNVVAIAAGHTHSLALRNDGTVAVWANWKNAFGVIYDSITNPPAGLSNVVAIEAGSTHSLALKADGTVVAWGWDDQGQCAVPPGLSNVVGIAAGEDHNLALQADGTIVAWGNNLCGEGTVPPGLSGVVALAAGILHSVALKGDGSVVAWGWSQEGSTNVPADLTNVIAISACSTYSLALRADGTIVTWSNTGMSNIPTTLTNAIAIAAGSAHALALKADGTVVEWGPYDSYFPTGLSNVIAISASSQQSLALIGPATDTPSRLVHPRLSSPARAGNTLGMTLPTLQGKRYSLECITSLAQTNWTSVTNVQGVGYGLERTLTDPSAISSQRFYRVRIE